ncbi:AGL166Wp [Eremothecium gossypii ATCC 10895]|uniref:AGL166Wp n=1 Tax=Eremothecium gossypii (strain ATCC 10895 / CBS 109.51 / FGSC 9923 / NRRL Y-1056) TaxID=284811 RepID=Q750V5_EREGS|nr:AGL166Wp [Eremothecium gossypii ATCC 10895]AAS54325.2 AGL166Wp [Eremothecium gossypii ATCC 10895]AEY98651.1 FAGL166Wp [Eremothecium gossypii FDAG1]
MAKRKAADERLRSLKRRNCIPLERYSEIFNQEVQRVFDPHWHKNEFRDSVVHLSSKVRYLQDTDEEHDSDARSDSGAESDSGDDSGDVRGQLLSSGELGTFWSAREKQVFFHWLARCSIHRLDEWAPRLPDKSKYEILAYYHVLKSNLQDLKRMNTKKRGGILTKRALPIAYEMDPFFVQLEEEYSLLIHSETENVVKLEDEADLEDGVVNWENWYKRWDPLYSHHRLGEYQPAARQPLPFSRQSELLVERLVRAYTRRLLFHTVVPLLELKHVPRASLLHEDLRTEIAQRAAAPRSRTPLVEAHVWDSGDIEIRTGNLEFPHLVAPADVWRALLALRAAGHLAPTLPETVVSTVTKFDLHHPAGKLFKNRAVPAALVVPMLLHKSAPYALVPAIPPPCPPLAHSLEKKLHLLLGKRALPPHGFIDDDPYDSIDNPIYAQLFSHDTAATDAVDIQRSRLYQHAVITHMHGADNDSPFFRFLPSPVLAVPPPTHPVPSAVVDLYQYCD